MIRLEKHEELVRAMTRAIENARALQSSGLPHASVYARSALAALLAAVVEKGVGAQSEIYDVPKPYPVIVIELEKPVVEQEPKP